MNETPSPSQLLIYQSEDGRIRLDVRFDEGELTPDSVLRRFRMTAADGKPMPDSLTMTAST